MDATPKCPKCGFLAKTPFAECPRCGIIVRKFLERRSEARNSDAMPARESSQLPQLADAHALMIRQNKEWGEILTGIETLNRYDVVDQANRPLMKVEEEGGSIMEFLTRFFLKSLRPFKMNLSSSDGTLLYRLVRPFRFYFYELEVIKPNGDLLGTVKRRFSILRRIYTVTDGGGREAYELFGPLLHPWTFQIRRNQQELGAITKKWSGLGKEFFTDADNFGILFPDGVDVNRKAVLLGAVFLIDFVHFENSGNN